MENQTCKYLCALLLISGCAQDRLRRACPDDCVGIEGEYTEIEETNLRKLMGTGVCKTDANPQCDDYNRVIKCEAVLPSEEVCNGADDDCDGTIDEGLHGVRSRYFSSEYPNDVNPCFSTIGECANAQVSCVNGWQCDYTSNGIVVEENDSRCDNLDNDCDGLKDEDFYGKGCFGDWPPEEFWRFTQEECRPGVELCVDGTVECVGLREPTIEICDSVDNDCNGVIDDSPEVFTFKYDVAIIIDRSGSMFRIIEPVAEALTAYVAQFDGILNIRFAVVDITHFGTVTEPGLVYKIIDFVSPSEIRDTLFALRATGSPNEASLDGANAVCDVANNPLNLNWDPESRKMFFMFTDEECQTYTDPRLTKEDVIDTCQSNNVYPFIWFSSQHSQTCLADVANGANGIGFEISVDSDKMLEDMNSILTMLCGVQ